jgi:hypothetical protein
MNADGELELLGQTPPVRILPQGRPVGTMGRPPANTRSPEMCTRTNNFTIIDGLAILPGQPP